MNQTRLSELIELFLKNKYPEFLPTLKYQVDGSFDCELRSLSNEFSIWIATYNSEITIGLVDPDGSTDIHTHISCYHEEDVNDALYDLSTRINEIKHDKLILYYSERTGYDWTCDINSVYEKRKPEEDIRAYSWKDSQNGSGPQKP
ncbi:hypothetical protein [Desertivirga brevis]|uniref:hypothetical protein n=1 Tax=Desertivirga brevis TaxID=2810310 RepID=UPI001A9595EF|nr:hypothetical protein [Pedobacter sp. SYSU D00873]